MAELDLSCKNTPIVANPLPTKLRSTLVTLNLTLKLQARKTWYVRNWDYYRGYNANEKLHKNTASHLILPCQF